MEKLAGLALPAEVTTFRVQVTSGQGLPFHEDIGRLQGEFIRRIDQHLTTKGRRMVGWDEILEGGLKDGSRAVVMAWRGAVGRRRNHRKEPGRGGLAASGLLPR